VHRALLVAHQDVAHMVLLEERIVDRQHGASGIAENDIDALIDQSADDHLRSRHLPRRLIGRHDALPRPLSETKRPRTAHAHQNRGREAARAAFAKRKTEISGLNPGGQQKLTNK
jgi:hypothetical protein